MALFKVLRGAPEDLSSVPLHDGYSYVCISGSSDNATFWTDAPDPGNPNTIKRFQIGAPGGSVQYAATLAANNWSGNSAPYSYTLALTSLKCGSGGNVSPNITPTSNIQEYSLIASAAATPGVGIVFTAQTKPSNDISIIIQDMQ